MLSFRKIATFAMLIGMAATAYCQDLPPSKLEVDTAEATRRGDWVTIAGEGPRAGAEQAFLIAMAPPTDDSHKWYVTVFKDGGPQSEALVKDFIKKVELASFVVDPNGDGAKAWAHYNVYDISDKTQEHRIKQYGVTTGPVVVIQPPRNGMWGDPAWVVWQSTPGYDGDSRKLANTMTEFVKAYAEKMSRHGYPKAIHDGSAKAFNPQAQSPSYVAWTAPDAERMPAYGAAQMPFPQPPQPSSVPSVLPSAWPQVNPQPQTTPVPVAPSPTPAPTSNFIQLMISFLMGSGMGGMLGALAMKLAKAYTATTPTPLDDLIVAGIEKAIQKMYPNLVQSVRDEVAQDVSAKPSRR